MERRETYLDAALRPIPALRALLVELLAVVFGRADRDAIGVIPRRKVSTRTTTRPGNAGGEKGVTCVGGESAANSTRTYPRLKDDPPLLGICLASPKRHTSYV